MKGIELKLALVRKRMKSQELARATGIPASTLSKIINEWREPSPDEERKIDAAVAAFVTPPERLARLASEAAKAGEAEKA